MLDKKKKKVVGWCDGLMGLVDSPFWLLSESLECVISK